MAPFSDAAGEVEGCVAVVVEVVVGAAPVELLEELPEDPQPANASAEQAIRTDRTLIIGDPFSIGPPELY